MTNFDPLTNMPLRQVMLFNSISGKLEPLPVDRTRELTWYTCGPTVYDSTHLGHARTFVQLDIMKRCLQQMGYYIIKYVMNITDIDDKILSKAKELNIPPSEHARKMEDEFWKDMQSLGVYSLETYNDNKPRVSEHIPEIIAYIQDLVKRGFAQVKDDGVYFDSKAFVEAGHTLPTEWSTNASSTEADFALWKCKDDYGWESPWGKGRPGWHIECTVMSHQTLGPRIDIHSGGCDLKFPHHSNELAQSKCIPGQTIGHFLHIGHLHIDGRKMSKSEKNFITIKDALKQFPNQRQGERTLRILFATNHWHQPMHFTKESLQEAQAMETRLATWFADAEATIRSQTAYGVHPFNIETLLDLLADNLRFQDAFDYLTSTLFAIPRDQISHAVYHEAKEWLESFFGLTFESPKLSIDPIMDIVVQQREKLRALAKQLKQPELFLLADEMRIQFASLGVLLEDKGSQSNWKLVH